MSKRKIPYTVEKVEENSVEGTKKLSKRLNTATLSVLRTSHLAPTDVMAGCAEYIGNLAHVVCMTVPDVTEEDIINTIADSAKRWIENANKTGLYKEKSNGQN